MSKVKVPKNAIKISRSSKAVLRSQIIAPPTTILWNLSHRKFISLLALIIHWKKLWIFQDVIEISINLYKEKVKLNFFNPFSTPFLFHPLLLPFSCKKRRVRTDKRTWKPFIAFPPFKLLKLNLSNKETKSHLQR